MNRLLTVLAFVTIGVVTASLFGSDQSINIDGTLTCGRLPASDVLVKIIDTDTGGPDDELTAVYTDFRGFFNATGFANELTSLDIVLEIYHTCDDRGKPCVRKWEIDIPGAYLTHGTNVPNKTFHAGEINLEVKPDGEVRDCNH